ncbi:MAG: hypothetical protein GXP14_00440 [Gammaproteobacteria bacterium]|nr:hypothetical protein [Gammaproteobacteria bacterium]
MIPANRQGADFAWLLLLGVLLAVCSIWLISNNFSNEVALRDWVKVLGVMDADQFRIEHLGLNAPHVPLYLLMPFSWLPSNSQGAAPYLLSSLLVALLLVIWNYQLRQKQLTLWQRFLLLLLVLLQVPLLWAATTGENLALTLLVFYFVYRTCLRMSFEADLRSFIMLGILLALLFFIDAGALFIYIALFPFFALIAPRRIFLASPISVYIVIAIPLAVAVLAWGYLGWIFEGTANNFIHQPNSTFLGGWQHTPESPWLIRYGGQWLAPLGASVVLLIVYFPIFLLLLALLVKHKNHLKVSLVLLCVPLIAIAFASSKFYLERPVEMLALLMVGVMAELSVIQIRQGWKFPAVVLLLFVGGISGWYHFLQTPDPVARDWQKALLGHQDNRYEADLALGQFLSRHRGEMLIDDLTAYRAIAARGDAEKMALPRSDQFKLQTRQQRPDIEYIVVPNPRIKKGGWDRINKHFPDLYHEGMKGYRRIYDDQGWRVFRHVSD